MTDVQRDQMVFKLTKLMMVAGALIIPTIAAGLFVHPTFYVLAVLTVTTTIVSFLGALHFNEGF